MNERNGVERMGRRVGYVAGAVAWMLLAAPAAVRAEGTCLIGSKVKDQVSAERIEDADGRYSVLRPCKGQVRQGEVELIYSVGDGVTQRSRVGATGSIQSQLSQIEKRPLVDIWPARSYLATALAFAQGKRSSTLGTSGFDGASGGMPVQGDVVAVPGFKLYLRMHGLAVDQPVRFSQGNWSVDVAPVQGVVDLPVDRLKPGQLKMFQGNKSAMVTVLPPTEVADLFKEVGALQDKGLTPGELAVRRAVLFQDYELKLNALSEIMSVKGE